ncbi:hypothetical protein [Polaribacter porphyrae]|uniref:Uncharacterized protein n=1 Tax=Polaribacter porphyrae TaxID=1137780 RepID=A0A2S7WT97_9FLAO|nr:hypothetical protein [Polaribacter porphyrae]PQJ80829.1 hypothetical protein BTO18_17345 [Polaribacter porphyrae]
MELQLKIIGILLSILAFIHIGFPKYFNWKIELKSMSLINQQMMTVHTFFIALVVFLIGLLCLTSANELIETNLGKKISFGLGVFWLIRLVFQLFIYSPKLWKGKKFETVMHIVFTIFWIYMSILFTMIYFQ